MDAKEGYPILLAAKLAGVTRLTLDNWDRRGFLKASIPAPARGQSRIYSFRDLVAIRVASHLRESGIGVGAMKRVVRYLRSRKGLLSTSEVLATSALITDGLDVYEVEGNVMVSALRCPGQRVLFLVPLGTIVSELQRLVRSAAA